MVLLELPSSLISIIVSIVLEFFLIRPLGFRTDTIGDKEKFTQADALPRPFFLDDQYALTTSSALHHHTLHYPLSPSITFSHLPTALSGTT